MESIYASPWPRPQAGEHDITEKVQVLYDLAHSSMDWGSGMLDAEEMRHVIEIAILMGWEVPSLESHWGLGGPVVEMARQFPDHYEVTEVPYYVGLGDGRMRSAITTKKKGK